MAITRIRTAPPERWCRAALNDNCRTPLPDSVLIETNSMRQTVQAPEEDRTTDFPERTLCGGRFWRRVDGPSSDQNVWMCEHTLEVD